MTDAAQAGDNKPKVVVDRVNPDVTADQIGKVMSGADALFDRGVPVHVVEDAMGRAIAHPVSPAALVNLVAKVARPINKSSNSSGSEQT